MRSVRVRATVGASVVVLVALVFVGLALVVTLRNSQISGIDNTLERRAVDIESLLDGGASPASVAVASDEDGLVQIVDPDGVIVASSVNVADGERVSDSPAGMATTEGIAALGNEDFRVLVHPTDGSRRFTIIVGTTLENSERTQNALIGALVIGIPALLALIAAMVWVVIGRALHPVEAIRSRVAEIGSRQLDQRVPVPPTNDEISRLASTMNQMLDRLQDSSNRQERFVSDASHELRTPIATIRHELEVALRADSDEHWRDTAQEVLDEDLRMQRLVEDLLFMARHEQRPPNDIAAKRALVDLDDIVAEEVRRHRSHLTIDTSDVSAGQVRGNADHLGRVVRNLLDNATRHAATSVAVHVASENGRVVLDIDDDGPGVREQHRGHIFERFGRTDDARTRDDGGTGIGLSIARDIVTHHGGTITVADSPWLGGARFTVTLLDARAIAPMSEPNSPGQPRPDR